MVSVPVTYLKDMLEINGTKRSKGHQFKLIVQQSRTGLRQSFFGKRAVGQWNNLPENVAASESLVSFKRRLDEHFTDGSWYINTHGTRLLIGRFGYQIRNAPPVVGWVRLWALGSKLDRR